MGSATGIELGPASCVLVAARTGAAGADVSAVHVIEPSQWAATDVAIAEALRTARRTKKFSRQANVVLWSLDRPASPNDLRVRAALRPVLAAGFKVRTVLTPAQALAEVAATRRRRTDGATAWLSINMHGAAIAIVRGPDTLYATTVGWTYDTGALSVREQLLRRYLLVSHIAPQLKRAMAIVRAQHGAVVETVVTCGDLPDLRSLTMPLIEELDLEVETLDSAEGLHAVGAAAQDRFAEWAPTIRLACAAALLPGRRASTRMPFAIAAAVLLGVVGLATYFAPDRSAVHSVDGRIETNAPPVPVTSPVVIASPQVSAPPTVPAPGSMTESNSMAPAPQLPSQPQQQVTPPPQPEVTPLPPQGVSPPPPRVPPPPQPINPPPQQPINPSPPRPIAPLPQQQAAPLAQTQTAAAPVPPQVPPPVRRPVTTTSPGRAARPGRPTAYLVPMPRVTSILIDRVRRLAMIDGAILAEGDLVGSRLILRIDPETVLLREPSGAEVRLLLRSSLPVGVKSIPLAELGRQNGPMTMTAAEMQGR